MITIAIVIHFIITIVSSDTSPQPVLLFNCNDVICSTLVFVNFIMVIIIVISTTVIILIAIGRYDPDHFESGAYHYHCYCYQFCHIS